MAGKEKAPKKPKEKTEAKPQKQADLPGMEDRQIAELEEKAIEYAGIRDKRMALTPQEHALQEELLGLMKKYKKTVYTHRGVKLTVVAKEERVKVKIEDPDKADE